MTRRTLLWALAQATAVMLRPSLGSAQDGIIGNLRAILDASISTSTTTTTDASGGASTTTTNSLYPRLTLNTDTLLFPSLRLNAGGVFEVNLSDSAFNGGGTETTLTYLRPFVELRSINPTFAPGFGYYRRENRTRLSAAPTLTLVNEDYAGYLSWKPVGLPQSEVQYIRTNTFDRTRASQDLTKDFGSILSRYTYKRLGLYYLGSYLGTTDRARGVDSRQVSNAGRLDHSAAFFSKRLRWNTIYNVNHQTLSSRVTGDGGEVALPVVAFAGLSALSDTPATVALQQNALLADGGLATSSGINLGLPALGTDLQARNVGLDFASPAAVDRLLVWIDRELPPEIANAFSWEIYSSPDNLTWTREGLVTAAPFGPFETRFQLDFRGITARYLKVVTRPLSPAVIDASRYPVILVTELQAFVTQVPDDARLSLARTTQLLNTDVRLRILDTPTVHYEGSYWYTGVRHSGQTRETLSNGVSVSHAFSRAVSVYGRGAREQGQQSEGRRVAAVTNATLTYNPIRTFTSSLLFTGLNEDIAGRRNERNSLFLQTSSQLYRGVDLQVGGGWTFTTRETGETVRDRLVNLTASVTPRPNLLLMVNYADTTTTRLGAFTGNPRFQTKRAYITVAVDPTRTLHLVLAEEVLATGGARTRTTHNIGINWAPFPDGALQFLFAYNEALRALDFGSERILRPSVRWTFSRQSYIDVSYQRITSEYVLQTTESRILSADFKMFF